MVAMRLSHALSSSCIELKEQAAAAPSNAPRPLRPLRPLRKLLALPSLLALLNDASLDDSPGELRALLKELSRETSTHERPSPLSDRRLAPATTPGEGPRTSPRLPPQVRA